MWDRRFFWLKIVRKDHTNFFEFTKSLVFQNLQHLQNFLLIIHYHLLTTSSFLLTSYFFKNFFYFTLPIRTNKKLFFLPTKILLLHPSNSYQQKIHIFSTKIRHFNKNSFTPPFQFAPTNNPPLLTKNSSFNQQKNYSFYQQPTPHLIAI